MTENTVTLVDVSPPRSGEPPEELPPLTAAEQETVRELVRQARASGTSLTGPGGLLKQLTKMVVEAALDEEMSEHLGYGPPVHPCRSLGARSSPHQARPPRPSWSAASAAHPDRSKPCR